MHGQILTNRTQGSCAKTGHLLGDLRHNPNQKHAKRNKWALMQDTLGTSSAASRASLMYKDWAPLRRPQAPPKSETCKKKQMSSHARHPGHLLGGIKGKAHVPHKQLRVVFDIVPNIAGHSQQKPHRCCSCSLWMTPLRRPIRNFLWMAPLRRPIPNSVWMAPLRRPIRRK